MEILAAQPVEQELHPHQPTALFVGIEFGGDDIVDLAHPRETALGVGAVIAGQVELIAHGAEIEIGKIIVMLLGALRRPRPLHEFQHHHAQDGGGRGDGVGVGDGFQVARLFGDQHRCRFAILGMGHQECVLPRIDAAKILGRGNAGGETGMGVHLAAGGAGVMTAFQAHACLLAARQGKDIDVGAGLVTRRLAGVCFVIARFAVIGVRDAEAMFAIVGQGFGADFFQRARQHRTQSEFARRKAGIIGQLAADQHLIEGLRQRRQRQQKGKAQEAGGKRGKAPEHHGIVLDSRQGYNAIAARLVQGCKEGIAQPGIVPVRVQARPLRKAGETRTATRGWRPGKTPLRRPQRRPRFRPPAFRSAIWW